MKHSVVKAAMILGFSFGVLGVQAAPITIDFNGLTAGDEDPTIGGVSFSAGASPLNSTFVEDYLTPGNNFLLNGWADGENGSPAAGYDTYIGVAKSGALFDTVTFDIASIGFLPPSTTLGVEAYLGGTLVSSASLMASDEHYHSLSISLVTGFDSLRIFDDLDSNGFGAEFRIDNFAYTEVSTSPPNPAPEPSVMLLMAAGLGGLAGARRAARAPAA